MSDTQQTEGWTVLDKQKGNERTGLASRSEAEKTKKDLVSRGADPQHIEIVPPELVPPGDSLNAESDDRESDAQTADELIDSGKEMAEGLIEDDNAPITESTTPNNGVSLPETPSVDQDPLDILPAYMITTVDGKPSLNKRGVSVLAYHYDISVTDKETIAYPHETDYTSAIVEITVEGEDGRVFVGAGEAHADETPKHQLLRMAETRAYKRAVIFATGCGIVGYQEMMETLQ